MPPNTSAQPIDIFVENNHYQHLDVLKRNRKKRQKFHEIFVEGVTSINALVKTGYEITSVAFSRDKELSDWAKTIIAAANPPRLYRLTADLMTKLSDRTDPSELIVTARPKNLSLDDIPLGPNLFVLIFERPSNHGNLGSLIRSCDAFGVDAVITTGHGVDVYDPAVIRASLGAVFYSRVIHAASSTTLEQWIGRVREHIPGVQLVGTQAEAPISLHESKVAPPLILVLGTELWGMGQRLAQLVDTAVAIPMQGHVDSLNVACAGSILLYQIKQNALQHLPS
jgi:23S rRNA (uridine2479-2'-O)-methyltransferase